MVGLVMIFDCGCLRQKQLNPLRYFVIALFSFDYMIYSITGHDEIRNEKIVWNDEKKHE